MSEAPTKRRLNVGCGRNIKSGWINLDAVALPGVDIVTDLERCREQPLPIPSDSIDEFLLSHVIEHIRDPLAMMQELHRVARPGAIAVVRVPHGASDDAWEDPTHVRAYFVGSFGYFSQPFYWRADYGYRGDWLTTKVTLVVDRAAHEGFEPREIYKRTFTSRNLVTEIIAELQAVKPVRKARRELQVQPHIEIHMA